MELKKKKSSSPSNDQSDIYYYKDVLSFPDEEQSHKWSVSWSDLMMTMFIFFAVLYLYQVGDKDPKFGSGPGISNLSEQGANGVVNIDIRGKTQDIYDQTKQAIHEVMIDQKAQLNLNPDNTVRITLAGDLFFDPGSAVLKIGAKYQLNQIAKVLNENDYVINVVGHAPQYRIDHLRLA